MLVNKILRNPAYCGKRKNDTDYLYPAIVSEELFNNVQFKMNNYNKRCYNSKYKTLLKGLPCNGVFVKYKSSHDYYIFDKSEKHKSIADNIVLNFVIQFKKDIKDISLEEQRNFLFKHISNI